MTSADPLPSLCRQSGLANAKYTINLAVVCLLFLLIAADASSLDAVFF
jgi:hypothetical protein